MKGSETKLVSYMQGSDKRFVIPVYQRNYDWKTENCKQLYDDLIKVICRGRKSHFFGSIVSVHMLCITNMLLHGIDVPKIYHDNSLLKDVLDYTRDDQFDVILMNPPYGGNEKTEVKNHFPADLASSETADLFMSVIMYRLKKDGRAAVILPDGFLFGTDNAKVAIKKKLFSEFNLHTVIRMPHSVFSPYTSITTNILFFDRTKPTEETWFYRLDMPEGYQELLQNQADGTEALYSCYELVE